MRETVTLTYVNPRSAVIRLLRSTDFTQFDLKADSVSFRNCEYREFFSGRWAQHAEKVVRSEFEIERGLENVHLLGLIIMTDSSTINLSSSKKPFYIAFANTHYSYRNNIESMECIGYIPDAPKIKFANYNQAELKRFIQYSVYDHFVKELDMDKPIKFQMNNGLIYNFVIRVRLIVFYTD